MKNFKLIIGIGILAVIVLGAFMLLRNNAQTPITQQSGNPERVVTDDVREFNVSGVEYAFSPTELRVKQGERVRIVFNNTQGFHDLRIVGYETGTKQINEGETDTVEFLADKSGEFEYFCSVGNHRQQGMVGKLVVE